MDQKLLGQGRQLRHHAGDVFVGQKAHQQPQLLAGKAGGQALDGCPDPIGIVAPSSRKMGA